MHFDKLNIKNMSFYAFHGDDIKERELGQRYEVDIELKIDTIKATKEDNVEFTKISSMLKFSIHSSAILKASVSIRLNLLPVTILSIVLKTFL